MKIKFPFLVSALTVMAVTLAGCSSSSNTNQADAGNIVHRDYKDGTYTALGNYRSPAGPEQIAVTLTLSKNIITDATVVSKATATRSKMMQGMFIDNFKPYVVGKDINGLRLSKVSGSSLTPQGFDDALAQIETQALQ